MLEDAVMKKYKFLDIQSVSDIITNSSSEVFVINSNNDALKELIEKLNINPFLQL